MATTHPATGTPAAGTPRAAAGAAAATDPATAAEPAAAAGSTAGPVTGSGTSGLGADLGLSADELREMYSLIVLTRALDERMWVLNRAGKIPFVISGQGHEGAQVGLAYGLRKGHDWMAPYYRSVASLITFGMSARDIMLAQFARAVDPSSGGRQMPGHYANAAINALSVSSPVTTQVLHATGIAYAAKVRGTGQVAITYLGEGSSNQGDMHEAMNFAGIHRLPVIFVIENNGYAISVPQLLESAVPDLAVRAAGYGMPGVIVDGAEVLDCYREGKAAIDRARNGDGPTLIEAKVTRLTAHSSDDQHTKYRSAEELEAQKSRDPLPRFRAELLAAGVLDEASDAAIAAEARRVVEDATDWAEAQPLPDPETAQRWVYADAPPARMDDPLWRGRRFMGDGGPLHGDDIPRGEG